MNDETELQDKAEQDHAQLSQTQIEMQAAVYRRLVKHLRDNPDVQNIDLMNLASFCRNCLSKWYVAAAEEKGEELDYDSARELVYGMPYKDWKTKYQTEATPEQKAAYDAKHNKHS